MIEPKYEDIEGEIVDERTGEQIPRGALALTSHQTTKVDLANVGKLKLTPEAEASLSEKLDPLDVKIRPDGMVYLTWTYYAGRLNKAFGRLQWGLLPQGAPMVKKIGDYGDELVVWGFWLAIQGVPIGFSYGETTYKPSNATMTYGDACEGAKSIALARNCKQLGVALEMWDADWVANWKREYAEQYTNDRNRLVWRKKGSGTAQARVANQSRKPVDAPQTAQEAPGTPDAVNAPPKSSEVVQVAEMLAGVLTPKQLKLADNVVVIKAATKEAGQEVAIPAIMKYLKSLDKDAKLTISQVVTALTGENK